MALGDLPGHRHPSVATEGIGQVRQRAGNPVGRLVEHQGARLGSQRDQALAAPGSLAREEALEAEPARGEAAGDESGDGCGGAGNHLDHVTGRRGRGHQALARVGDARRSGIGDERHPSPLIEEPEHRPHLGRLGVVVHHQQPWRAHAGVFEQAPSASGVLAGDDVSGAEHLDRSRGEVAEVPDGGGHQGQGALRGDATVWRCHGHHRSGSRGGAGAHRLRPLADEPVQGRCLHLPGAQPCGGDPTDGKRPGGSTVGIRAAEHGMDGGSHRGVGPTRTATPALTTWLRWPPKANHCFTSSLTPTTIPHCSNAPASASSTARARRHGRPTRLGAIRVVRSTTRSRSQKATSIG